MQHKNLGIMQNVVYDSMKLMGVLFVFFGATSITLFSDDTVTPLLDPLPESVEPTKNLDEQELQFKDMKRKSGPDLDVESYKSSDGKPAKMNETPTPKQNKTLGETKHNPQAREQMDFRPKEKTEYVY